MSEVSAVARHADCASEHAKCSIYTSCRYAAETPARHGVSKSGSGYKAQMSISGERWHLGTYATEREARVVWDAANMWRTMVNKAGG